MAAVKYDFDFLTNMPDTYPFDDKVAKAALVQARGMRVRFLDAHIHKPADVDHLAACAGVDQLWIWGWTEPDFQKLSHLKPSVVRLVRGRQTSLAGLNDSRLRVLWIDGPSKLKTLGPIAAPRVDLAACNALDLNSLGNVRGLLCANLTSMKTIRDLGFVERCDSLEGVSFAGHKYEATDMGPLIHSPSLQIIYSNKLKDHQVEEIGRGNRRVFVANELGCAFDKGKPVASYEYGMFADRWEAFLKKRRIVRDGD